SLRSPVSPVGQFRGSGACRGRAAGVRHRWGEPGVVRSGGCVVAGGRGTGRPWGGARAGYRGPLRCRWASASYDADRAGAACSYVRCATPTNRQSTTSSWLVREDIAAGRSSLSRAVDVVSTWSAYCVTGPSGRPVTATVVAP